MLKNIQIILPLLLLISCQAKVGNRSAINLYQDTIINGSSLDQITKIYGDYSDSWQDQNGNKIYQYSYSRSKYDLVSQLPIINHFGWVKSENYEVILIVDNQNKLIGQKKFYNQAKSRNSLVCNPEVYSCLRKIY